MAKEQEISTLYQGCPSVVETVAISNFLYFYFTQFSRVSIKGRFPGLTPDQVNLASSSLAAAINIVLTEPLWKANTVLKMIPREEAKKGNLITVILMMAKSDGLGSLWNGTTVSLWLISNPIIQFTVYEYLKRKFLRRGGKFTPVHAFFFGAISKAVATVVTYPLQVAQTRLRITRDTQSKTVGSVLLELYREKGLEGLFQGCSAKLSQTVLTAAFMFAFYERIHLALSKGLRSR